MSTKTEKLALLFALAAVALWSTVATAFELALRHYSPLTLLTIASSTSMLVLWLLSRHQLASCWQIIRQHTGLAISVAIINPTAYYLVLFAAYDLLPGSQAQALNYSWAMVLPIMAAIFLRQRLHWYDWLAMLVAYTGVVIIASQGQPELPDNLAGVGLALGSTLLWASYWIITRASQFNATTLMTVGFTLATPMLWLLSAWQGELPSLTWQGNVAAIYVGIFEMGITFVLWGKALALTQHTARTSNLIFLSPFISLVLLAVIVGEQIHPSTVLGLICIVLAILFQQWRGAGMSN
ncbi:DMT family transporter [Salinibius halmophilus]|uniref:DMT family transporter n=1 Tax=Salinibius halmophilus TaxID=1853216 RepID=UPI000E66CD03|nr:DMT family transporter [Salinibius halmophilus]